MWGLLVSCPGVPRGCCLLPAVCRIHHVYDHTNPGIDGSAAKATHNKEIYESREKVQRGSGG